MRRNGFTMVELIFVIIIIGILSVAALPKFGDIKDRAKVNNEYSALSSLDGAIEGAIAFHQEDHDDMAVHWHNESDTESNYGNGGVAFYQGINAKKHVLSHIVKKGDTLKIVGYIDLDSNGTTADNSSTYDLLFIEGEASNHITGVRKEQDTPGKPDRNDVWVFNTSPYDINVSDSSSNSEKVSMITLYPGEMKLLDSNLSGQQSLTLTNLTVVGGSNNTTDLGGSRIKLVP
ncbi:MAG: hypothetical protein DSZ06_00580 [Sulfurospirillum sp.]|nr:MAG: hypothetical protein DSZ06_00580 [Sulfurospirillum sp.]